MYSTVYNRESSILHLSVNSNDFYEFLFQIATAITVDAVYQIIFYLNFFLLQPVFSYENKQMINAE